MTIQHKIHGYSGEQYNARPDQQPGSPWRSGFANYTPGGHASFSGALEDIKRGGPGRTAPAGAVGLQSPAPAPSAAPSAAPGAAPSMGAGAGSVINPTWQTYVQRRLSALGPNATPADIQAIHDEASTKFSKHADAGLVATASPSMMNQSAEAARAATAAPAAARAPAAPRIQAPAIDAGAAPQQLRMLGDAANGLMRGDKGTVQTQGGGTITTNTVPTPLPDAGQVTGRKLTSPYGGGSITMTGAAPQAARQATVAALDAKYPAVAAASRSTSPAMPSMDAITQTVNNANDPEKNGRAAMDRAQKNAAPAPATLQGLQVNKPAFMQPSVAAAPAPTPAQPPAPAVPASAPVAAPAPTAAPGFISQIASNVANHFGGSAIGHELRTAKQNFVPDMKRAAAPAVALGRTAMDASGNAATHFGGSQIGQELKSAVGNVVPDMKRAAAPAVAVGRTAMDAYKAGGAKLLKAAHLNPHFQGTPLDKALVKRFGNPAPTAAPRSVVMR